MVVHPQRCGNAQRERQPAAQSHDLVYVITFGPQINAGIADDPEKQLSRNLLVERRQRRHMMGTIDLGKSLSGRH
jgi:hypothetical protein